MMTPDEDEVIVTTTGGLWYSGRAGHKDYFDCKVTRFGGAGTQLQAAQVWSRHECEDHDVVIIWPNRVYAGICNCGGTREPHPATNDCPTDRRIG